MFIIAEWSRFYFFLVQQPLVCQGLLIIKASQLHSDTSQSVGLLWMSDQPDAGTCTWQLTTLRRERHPCPWWDSYPHTIPVTKWPQAHALYWAATGIVMGQITKQYFLLTAWKFHFCFLLNCYDTNDFPFLWFFKAEITLYLRFSYNQANRTEFYIVSEGIPYCFDFSDS
jgi:hypothetical protein